MLPALENTGGAACGQDLFVAEILGCKRGGVFVDIGANDGVTISNSYYFEKQLDWSGVAIEPLPSAFEKLQENRDCYLVNGCVSPDSKKAKLIEMGGSANMLSTLEENNTGLTARRLRRNKFRHKTQARTIDVDCFTFSDVMERFGVQKIDFLSVDTEGGELDILKSIDFGVYSISAISVENNYYTHDIRRFLESEGFVYIGTFKVDEIYIFGGLHLRSAMLSGSHA